MVESKSLKLKLGLCGLALTSFLALNSRSVVHADTVNGGNASAITWDSDQDDSQVVKSETQQSQPTQNAQEKAPATQSVQSSVQNRVEKSVVRVSNFDTSTVNRLNANSVRNNQVKVATVHDTAQMPVQKTKVAQFNNGSKIYTLNGSTQLSKNNGDGYVITNAGTYNGRAVDIGVTINGVQDNQGTYTTKWSNGDNANVTGKTDASFKYQDSVLAGTQQDNVTVPNKTRNRTENKTITKHVDGYWGIYYSLTNHTESDTDGNNPTFSDDWIIDPQLLADVMAQHPEDSETDAINRILRTGIVDDTQSGLTGAIMNTVSELGKDEGKHYDKAHYDYLKRLTRLPVDKEADFDAGNATYNWYTGDVYVYHSQIKPGQTEFAFKARGNAADHERTITEYSKQKFPNLRPIVNGYSPEVWQLGKLQITKYSPYKNATLSPNGATGSSVQPVQVTDHLQAIKNKDASLNYNYTVGLYDAQTGELITDLKPEYKGKTGATATAASSVMNNAIKSKIQQINQGKATVSYTGTRANDDVAFYQETRQVNPQDKNVNRQVQRVIHINFPNGVKPKSYDSITDSAGNKLTLDSNNNLTQSMSFTRTGVQNIVNGHVTYGNWQQHGAINAVTLPSIPGYTMVTNN